MERRHVDAVLPLIVGGTTPVDTIIDRCRPPRIQIVAPFSRHAVDDIAVSVHEKGRNRGALTIFREKVRVLSRRRFDQSCREIELRECRLEFFFEIGAQRTAPVGILAFGLIADPAIEFGEKLAGMKMLVRAVDSVGSGHVSVSRSRTLFESGQRIGIRRQAEVRAAQGVCFCHFPSDGDSISDSKMAASKHGLANSRFQGRLLNGIPPGGPCKRPSSRPSRARIGLAKTRRNATISVTARHSIG